MRSPEPSEKSVSQSRKAIEEADTKTASYYDGKEEEMALNDRRTLSWENIRATVPIQGAKSKDGGGRRLILDSVSGVAKPGEVLAIMGGSGAGKTTLLNILTLMRSSTVQWEGSVKVNGEVVTTRDMNRMSAYVQQVDLFCGTLTVKEHLVFSAQLRMQSSVTNEQRMKKVSQVIKEMNLVDCQNTMIGIPNREKGISIGEKKRLAFASEVLTDPAILFCDEPTSGLDSFMASQVVSALRMMANQGKAVVTVIHQPSSSVFNMFDTVCFMANGKAAYHGPVNRLCRFFDSLGVDELRVPESHNPADHVISALSIEPGTRDADTKRVQFIQKAFEESEWGVALQHDVQSAQLSDDLRTAKMDEKMHRYATSFVTQLRVLTHRAFMTTLRDPLLLKVRLVQILLTTVVIGIVSFRTKVRGSTAINLEGVLYNTTRDMNFLFLFPSITVITSELHIVFREYKARVYSIESYYIAKSLAELPQYTILPLIYSIIVYWSTGLYGSPKQFIIYCAICYLLVTVAISIAYAGACIFAEEGMAVTYMPVFILPMLVFGGFYISFDKIPKYFQWLSYLSWFRYGFEGLSINQWKDYGDIPESVEFDSATGKNLTFPATGIELLKVRGMSPDFMIADVLILVVMAVVYRVIGLGALLLRVRYAKSG